MSCLQNEILLEQCYDDAYEQFRIHNKLNEQQMQELILHSGVQLAIEKSARKIFDGLCQ